MKRRIRNASEFRSEASYNSSRERIADRRERFRLENRRASNDLSSIQTSAMFRALRHRNFQLFFGGQLISLIGTWMQNVAQSWLVYRMTGSAFLLGVVGFAGQIPVFIFAPARRNGCRSPEPAARGDRDANRPR